MYNPNPNLIEQYRSLHNDGKFKGLSILKHVYEISDLVRETNSLTLLDYGCGRGNQYTDADCHKYWGGILPTLYDPAVPGHSQRPVGRFDGVICTDVAEHIPEEEIEDFLKDVFNYAGKFVFITICTREARKTLPDGRNAHLTVRPREWWKSKIESISKMDECGVGPRICISWNDT